MAYPIKYIENNLVWNNDGECFAYYELLPYNYSFLSPEQKFRVHDSFRQLIAQNRDGNRRTDRSPYFHDWGKSGRLPLFYRFQADFE